MIVLVMAAAAFTQSTGGVKGRVKDMNDRGIPNATVAARQNGKDVKTTTTDKKGEFTLDGLPEGVYNFAFDANGYSTGVKYNISVKKGKPVTLGNNLILTQDRGSLLLFRGSVFFSDGTSVPGATVEYSIVNSDGSLKKVGNSYTTETGEFGFRHATGPKKFRVRVKWRDASAEKDIDVEGAEVYRFSIILDIPRPSK